MKKTYITPEMEVIKVGAVSMLAASMGVNEDAVDTSGDGVRQHPISSQPVGSGLVIPNRNNNTPKS